MPIFSFLDDNVSKCQWIFTKLGICIDIVEICIDIANGQISSNFCQRHAPIFSFPDDNMSKFQGNLTKLGNALIWRKSGLGLLMGKFRQFLTELSACDMIMAGYYSLTFLSHVAPQIL